MEIKCIYKDGAEKTFMDEHSKAVLKRIVKGVERGKGEMYARFLQSPLQEMYIDGELVLDRKKILEGRNEA